MNRKNMLLHDFPCPGKLPIQVGTRERMFKGRKVHNETTETYCPATKMLEKKTINRFTGSTR